MKRYFLAIFFLSCQFGIAQTPTWSDKVAKIIYSNCTECHRSGGIAPFKLESYNDAQAYAMSIRSATSAGRMPPWHADASYRHFKGERILSAADRAAITDWVNGGAPAGNLANAPQVPVFSNGIKMQSPDKTFSIPVYSVGSNSDVYRCFAIPTGFTVDKFIAQLEFEPMNKSIVHHILLFQDAAQTCKNLDDADPDPGYSSSGGGVGSGTAELIGGWVPGGNLIDIPSGMGIKLKANSYFIVQIHYAPGSMTKKDSTRCHLKFSSTATPREVFVAPILHHGTVGNGSLTNGPLYIPANTVKTFNQTYIMSSLYDASIISVAPHMHLIGKSYKVYFVPNATTDTTPLIRIPDWDFHWQGAYTFQKVIKVPKSARIYGTATYDNTSNNVFNPSSPPKNVTLGEGTNDEMMLCYFTYTAYLPGDENIILDSTILNPNGLPQVTESTEPGFYPNPVTDRLHIRLDENNGVTQVILYDVQGQFIRNYEITATEESIDCSFLSEGMYFIEIREKNKIRMDRFIKK